MTRITHNGTTFQIEPVKTICGAVKKDGGFFLNLVRNPGPTEDVSGCAWFETKEQAFAAVTA